MSSRSKPSASLQVPALGASASVGGTDVSGSSSGTVHAGDDVPVVPPLTSACCVDSAACVLGADCLAFGVSRGSYADRLAFGRGKGYAHVETKPFPVCQSIAINLEEKTVEEIDQDLPINGSKVPVVDSVGSAPLVLETGSDTPSVDVVDGAVPSADVFPSEPSGGLDNLQIVGSALAVGCDRILDGMCLALDLLVLLAL
ncbi:hypothetical protein SUGI_0270310 [Cryptomeria japonica]|nr:hypothetical protein SUGI_0270310 [Cryptomeria japonica]